MIIEFTAPDMKVNKGETAITLTRNRACISYSPYPKRTGVIVELTYTKWNVLKIYHPITLTKADILPHLPTVTDEDMPTINAKVRSLIEEYNLIQEAIEAL